jgi:hypothetical protein
MSRRAAIAVLMGLAGAGFVAFWAWNEALDGDWSAQTEATVDVAYALCAANVAFSLAAAIVAVRRRSPGWIAATLVLLIVCVIDAAYDVFGIGLSRGPGLGSF